MAEFAFSLEGLSSEERDQLISTIVYVDKPKKVPFHVSDVIIPFEDIANYSLFYEQINEAARARVPNVADLRTGDMIITGGYRGVGTYYVIWLNQNLGGNVAVTEELSTAIGNTPIRPEANIPNVDVDLDRYGLTEQQWRTVALELEENDWYEDPNFRRRYPELLNDLLVDEEMHLYNAILERSAGQNGDGEDHWAPETADRNSNGFHNDGQHHCYFILHPDEMGYATPTPFSSAPSNYFKRDYGSALVDPLLTHSQSMYGRIIAEVSADDEWVANPRFPSRYYGHCDNFDSEYEITPDMIEWFGEEHSDGWGNYPNQLQRARDLLTRHFEIEREHLNLVLK